MRMVSIVLPPSVTNVTNLGIPIRQWCSTGWAYNEGMNSDNSVAHKSKPYTQPLSIEFSGQDMVSVTTSIKELLSWKMPCIT